MSNVNVLGMSRWPARWPDEHDPFHDPCDPYIDQKASPNAKESFNANKHVMYPHFTSPQHTANNHKAIKKQVGGKQDCSITSVPLREVHCFFFVP